MRTQVGGTHFEHKRDKLGDVPGNSSTGRAHRKEGVQEVVGSWEKAGRQMRDTGSKAESRIAFSGRLGIGRNEEAVTAAATNARVNWLPLQMAMEDVRGTASKDNGGSEDG